jgi:hypothetical protein
MLDRVLVSRSAIGTIPHHHTTSLTVVALNGSAFPRTLHGQHANIEATGDFLDIVEQLVDTCEFRKTFHLTAAKG